MKNLFRPAAAVAALSIALGGGVAVTRNNANDAPPIPSTLALAKGLCGKGDGLANRRAFFVRAAQAYAAELTPEMKRPSLMPHSDYIGYKITTEKPEAQAWFDQGLGHMFNFNHAEAIKSFQQAQGIDPLCAMCFWGEAFSWGPNINAPMDADAAAPAFAAARQAAALIENVSEKERALIDAIGERYAETPPADRSSLDGAFADAMDAAAKSFPNDDFIAVLSAEANMDTQPWNYWTDGGRTPLDRTARTLALLEAAIARNPDHPAAIHLYIHITEASQNPYRAAPHADRLAALAPGYGHLIHMPSHTYYRIGRFADSLAHNIKAVAADEAYLASSDAGILYEFGYFTHNIHFAMTSAQMAGDGETAIAMARKLDEKLPLDMAAAAPWVQPIKAAPLYAMVQFGNGADILSLEAPSSEMPFLQAAWHYARGEAYARAGDADAANAEAAAISKIIAEADLSDLVDGGVPALDILNIARLTVIARASEAAGDLASAIEAMEAAVELQSDLPYTEPPYWYYPAKQTLAGMLLRSGDHARAEQLFIETLSQSPNNAWVLYGLASVYSAQNDKNAAKYARAMFKDAWLGDDSNGLTIERL